MQTMDRIPDIYVKVLASCAGFHRLLSHGPKLTPSSSLVLSKTHAYAFRVEALRDLNEQLSIPDRQIHDATLLCVLALILASVLIIPSAGLHGY
jgi:hypothetical protein